MANYVFFAQVDSAKACDSVLHTAIWRSMPRRGVLKVLVSSHPSEIWATSLCFQHTSWSALPGGDRVATRSWSVAQGLPTALCSAAVGALVPSPGARHRRWHRGARRFFHVPGRRLWCCWRSTTWAEKAMEVLACVAFRAFLVLAVRSIVRGAASRRRTSRRTTGGSPRRRTRNSPASTTTAYSARFDGSMGRASGTEEVEFSVALSSHADHEHHLRPSAHLRILLGRG